jgi:hypothetical protein
VALALTIATVVLVFVTGFYAWQTWLMAQEMQKSRRLSVRPRLSLRLDYISNTIAVIRLENIGQGLALNVEGILHLLPSQAGTAPREERNFADTVIAPGQHHDFLPPIVGNAPMTSTQLSTEFYRLVFDASFESSLGEKFNEMCSIDDLHGQQVALHSAHVRVPPNYLKKIADELKRIADKP